MKSQTCFADVLEGPPRVAGERPLRRAPRRRQRVLGLHLAGREGLRNGRGAGDGQRNRGRQRHTSDLLPITGTDDIGIAKNDHKFIIRWLEDCVRIFNSILSLENVSLSVLPPDRREVVGDHGSRGRGNGQLAIRSLRGPHGDGQELAKGSTIFNKSATN